MEHRRKDQRQNFHSLLIVYRKAVLISFIDNFDYTNDLVFAVMNRMTDNTFGFKV